MFHFSRTYKPGWIACAPCGTQVRFAWVEPPAADGGGRPRVRWLMQHGWADALRALRHARRTGGLGRHRCVALLQRSQYQLLPMDAPDDVPREEWRAALRWRLKDMVDFPVETAAVDLLEVPASTSNRRQQGVIAVAAPAEALRPLVDAGEEAGVHWQALDVPETALRNLSALFATPGRAHALLHFGETHGTLVITADGELLLSRQIDVSQSQIADPNEAMRQQAFDRAGLELQRTVDGFERVFTQVSLERLHLLPGEGSEALADYVRELLYVPVLVADPATVLDFAGLPEAPDAAHLSPYLVAIGAALRTD